MRRIESESWGRACEWDGLNEFLGAQELPDGLQRIRAGNHNGSPVYLDLFVRLIPGLPLAVHFYGAQNFPRKSTEPTFAGIGLSSELNASFILFHDPSLSLTTDIGLGWYEGFEGLAAAPVIRQVIRHVARSYAAPRTVLWGGSAGGYAALRNVGNIPNAAALVWNPQTAIPRYQKKPVRRYAEVAFGTDKIEQGASATKGIQLDLTQLPSPNWSTSPIVYLQEADDRHVRRHLAYLLNYYQPKIAAEVSLRDTMFGLVEEQFYLHLSHWDPGHRRPPKPAIVEFLNKLLHSTGPFTETLQNLESASHELIRLSHLPQRQPLSFELSASITQSKNLCRVMQWGSQFGRKVTDRASEMVPFLVTRSILGQSIITAFSIRKSDPPKTALNLSSSEDNEHRLTLLRDRRASAKSALDEDSGLHFVVLDLLEELRGTVNAGRGFIATNHGLLRRIDHGRIVERHFGSRQHRALWLNRLDRLKSAVETSDATLVVLDIDATKLADTEWAWLRIPRPSAAVLEHWHLRVSEARECLTGAIWIGADSPTASFSESIDAAAQELASLISDSTISSRPGRR